MTLTQIAVFCAVAEHKSMTRAAGKLNMTQPGVSRIISELENEFEVQLFIRDRKQIFMTPQGKVCYESAIRVMKEVEILRSNLSKNKPLHNLNIGCSSGLGPYVLKQASIIFSKTYPSCRLHIYEDHPSVILDAIKDGLYNIGFIQQKLTDINIDSRKIGGDRIVLVAGKDYRLKEDRDVYSIKDIADENLIAIKKGSSIRRLIDSYAESQFVTLKPVWNCNSGDHALKLVEDGFGLSLLSDKTVDNSLKTGLLRELRTDFSITREYYAVWRKIYYLSPEEKYLINICSEIGETYSWENAPVRR